MYIKGGVGPIFQPCNSCHCLPILFFQLLPGGPGGPPGGPPGGSPGGSPGGNQDKKSTRWDLELISKQDTDSQQTQGGREANK